MPVTYNKNDWSFILGQGCGGAMEFVRASQFDLPALTRLWNQGYTGYFVSIAFTEPMMEGWLRNGDFDLEHSVVAMDGEAPAGFSLLGVRGDRGWIGGVGVVPAYRGQGLAYKLFAAHRDLWQAELPLRTVQLEVLTENWARKVYEAAGFTVARRLSILQGTLPADAPESAAFDATPADLFPQHAAVHASCRPVWQREPGWMSKALPPAARAIYTGSAAAPTGLAFYTPGEGSVRLADAAAVDDAAALALVRGLASRYPGQGISVVNEPEGGPIHRALTAIGCTEARAQYDMRWQQG
jgi:ribosomal protein S18 acetylase RimI-like enzyme